jgi:hypothetical protein
MYSACIHCAGNLGRNEALEAFPVGSRLAFDPKRGRLWVVCRACERWNLSPLDERWEAIEQAERRFRDARLRVSTDEIGLARLREGLDLIRIGDPQRPEMAAWRYGDQFGRRRKRQLVITGAVAGVAASLFGGALWAGMSGVFVMNAWSGGVWDTLVNGRPGKVVVRVRDDTGKLLVIQRRHARMTALEHGDDDRTLSLRVEHDAGVRIVKGAEAMRIAAQLLPTVNRFGGSRKRVQDAVGLLEHAGDPTSLLGHIQHTFGVAVHFDQRPEPKYPNAVPIRRRPGVLHALPLRERLALEMALHEESERRAMDGELHELTRAWREAEEIAAIADDMFVTPRVQERIMELRDTGTSPDQ